MSSLTNINNNSSVINVGRTTPVSPGQQPASGSIPVVVSYDQSPIPVVEQNKIQSEVALSLLGIPRAEVALGIFADVNTYDVNPAEWSCQPLEYKTGHGIKHLPEEAGALVEAPQNEVAVLTSKRFFRYQPGRVSAATFGVKSTISPASPELNLNPPIKKYGIFDKYDGYYWETIADGVDDKFSVVRRTQSLLKYIPVEFGNGATQQQQDYGIAGKAPAVTSKPVNLEATAVQLLINNRFTIADTAFANAVAVGGAVTVYLNGLNAATRAKCMRDMDFAIDAYCNDLKWGGNAHAIVNATTYGIAVLNNAAAEGVVHEKLRDAIISILTANNEINASNRITALAAYTISAVQGTQPSQSAIDTANYGLRSKLSTVFSIYNRYIGYIASEYTFNAGNTAVISATYSANPPSTLTATEIKYRCLRDINYIIDGYAKDLEFNGNSATVFNAKNYYFNGLQVYSQTVGGVPAEIKRHEFVKQLLTGTGSIVINSKIISSVATKFSLSTTQRTKLNSLSDLIINNFTTQYIGPSEFGSAPQFGNLILLRDNLIMVHAAVFDPSLLKPRKNIVVKLSTFDDSLETAEDSFVVGQHIRFVGNAAGLINEKIYKVVNVSGPKGNILKLSDPLAANDDVINITSTGTGIQYIEPNVPFILPKDYHIQANPAETFTRPDGAFPYKYTSDGILPAISSSISVGFIDTALDPTTTQGASTLRQQIDTVNLMYNNWIKQNVDPEYYSVYEYRIPRSRFSTDKLNGATDKVVYSDISTGNSGKVYAGQPVISNGLQADETSVWNLDFSKVTMLKIEFSWYGAVGALFLAYVPVGNGEARWVRVHHLRASNQLKISSLGNATLPITYLVYGGGDINSLGIVNTTDKSYGNASEHIVKYGASYYIDGGDRGTVRLYSYSNNSATEIYGAKYTLGNIILNTDTLGSYIDVSNISGLPSNKIFFMNAEVKTSSRQDQNVEVIWVDGDKLYLNRGALISTNGISILANRPSIVFGLKAKESILNISGTGVRNRVQVYPTSLSSANSVSTPVKAKIIKTPYFQPEVLTSGSFSINSTYTITTENAPLSTASSAYLTNNGSFVYGWFRANVGTVFGKLTKENGLYYFTLLETFSVPVIIPVNSTFLKEGRFESNGTTIIGSSDTISTKERLSSVFISSELQCPVPKTGTEIASFFLKSGSDQFDLQGYFDYNKDYLSFPLTNQVESLYIACSSTQQSTISDIGGINASLTWEEQ